jgi:hypothetical protein
MGVGGYATPLTICYLGSDVSLRSGCNRRGGIFCADRGLTNKAWKVFARLNIGFVGSNPTQDMDVIFAFILCLC